MGIKNIIIYAITWAFETGLDHEKRSSAGIHPQKIIVLGESPSPPRFKVNELD
jgi:hypothetical protein